MLTVNGLRSILTAATGSEAGAYVDALRRRSGFSTQCWRKWRPSIRARPAGIRRRAPDAPSMDRSMGHACRRLLNSQDFYDFVDLVKRNMSPLWWVWRGSGAVSADARAARWGA